MYLRPPVCRCSKVCLCSASEQNRCWQEERTNVSKPGVGFFSFLFGLLSLLFTHLYIFVILSSSECLFKKARRLAVKERVRTLEINLNKVPSSAKMNSLWSAFFTLFHSLQSVIYSVPPQTSPVLLRVLITTHCTHHLSPDTYSMYAQCGVPGHAAPLSVVFCIGW